MTGKGDSETDGEDPSAGKHQKNAKDAPSTEEDRNNLLQNASKFLDDPTVKDASIDKKRTFLRSKGISELEIEDLLTNDTCTKPKDAGTFPTQDPMSAKDPSSQNTSDSSSATPPPPIITYPEFLLHTQKPPPLITAQRLLTATYILSASAALTYGTSKYLVEPMRDSLNSARHSLFSNTTTNLENLNNKLEDCVSEIPSTITGVGVDGADADDEDPAHFFSLTKATQTSPALSRSPSPPANPPELPQSMAETQGGQLKALKSSLEEAKPNEDSELVMQAKLEDLTKYLDGLRFPGSAASVGRKAGQDGEDSLARLRGDIKGVKGVLLSARNFPGGFVR